MDSDPAAPPSALAVAVSVAEAVRAAPVATSEDIDIDIDATKQVTNDDNYNDNDNDNDNDNESREKTETRGTDTATTSRPSNHAQPVSSSQPAHRSFTPRQFGFDTVPDASAAVPRVNLNRPNSIPSVSPSPRNGLSSFRHSPSPRVVKGGASSRALTIIAAEEEMMMMMMMMGQAAHQTALTESDTTNRPATSTSGSGSSASQPPEPWRDTPTHATTGIEHNQPLTMMVTNGPNDRSAAAAPAADRQPSPPHRQSLHVSSPRSSFVVELPSARVPPPSSRSSLGAPTQRLTVRLAQPVHQQRFFGPGSGLRQSLGLTHALQLARETHGTDTEESLIGDEEEKQSSTTTRSTKPRGTDLVVNALSFATLTSTDPPVDASAHGPAAHTRSRSRSLSLSVSCTDVPPPATSPISADHPAPIHHGILPLNLPKRLSKVRNMSRHQIDLEKLDDLNQQAHLQAQHQPHMVSLNQAFAIATAPRPTPVAPAASSPHAHMHARDDHVHTPRSRSTRPRGSTRAHTHTHRTAHMHPPSQTADCERDVLKILPLSKLASTHDSHHTHQPHLHQPPSPTLTNSSAISPTRSRIDEDVTPDSWSTDGTPARSIAPSVIQNRQEENTHVMDATTNQTNAQHHRNDADDDQPSDGASSSHVSSSPRPHPLPPSRVLRSSALAVGVGGDVRTLLHSPSSVAVFKKNKVNANMPPHGASEGGDTERSTVEQLTQPSMVVNGDKTKIQPSTSRYSLKPTPNDGEYVKIVANLGHTGISSTSVGRSNVSQPHTPIVVERHHDDSNTNDDSTSQPGHLLPHAASRMSSNWHSRSGVIRMSDGVIATTPTLLGAIGATEIKPSSSNNVQVDDAHTASSVDDGRTNRVKQEILFLAPTLPPTSLQSPQRHILAQLDKTLHHSDSIPSSIAVANLEPWTLRGYVSMNHADGATTRDAAHEHGPAPSPTVGRLNFTANGDHSTIPGPTSLELQHAIRQYLPHTIPNQPTKLVDTHSYRSSVHVPLPQTHADHHQHGVDIFNLLAPSPPSASPSASSQPTSSTQPSTAMTTAPSKSSFHDTTLSPRKLLGSHSSTHRRHDSSVGRLTHAAGHKMMYVLQGPDGYVRKKKDVLSDSQRLDSLTQAKSYTQLHQEHVASQTRLNDEELRLQRIKQQTSNGDNAPTDSQRAHRRRSQPSIDWREILFARKSKPRPDSGGAAYLQARLAEIESDPRFDTSIDRTDSAGPIWEFMDRHERLDYLLRETLGRSLQDYLTSRPPTRPSEMVLPEEEMFSGFDTLNAFIHARDKVERGETKTPEVRPASTAINVARPKLTYQSSDGTIKHIERLETTKRQMGVGEENMEGEKKKKKEIRDVEDRRKDETSSVSTMKLQPPRSNHDEKEKEKNIDVRNDSSKLVTGHVDLFDLDDRHFILSPLDSDRLPGDVTFVHRSTRGTADALIATDRIRRSLVARAQAVLEKVNHGVAEMTHAQKETGLERAVREAEELTQRFNEKRRMRDDAVPSGSMTERHTSSTRIGVGVSLRFPLPPPSFTDTPHLASSRLSATSAGARIRIGAGSPWSRDTRKRLQERTNKDATNINTHSRINGRSGPTYATIASSSGVTTGSLRSHSHLVPSRAIGHHPPLPPSLYPLNVDSHFSSPPSPSHSVATVTAVALQSESPTSVPTRPIPPIQQRERPQVFSWNSNSNHTSSPVDPHQNDIHTDYLSRLNHHRNETELNHVSSELLTSIASSHMSHVNERLTMDLQVKLLEQEELEHQIKLKRRQEERTKAIEKRRESIMA